MKNIKIYIASVILVLITGRCKEINPFEGVSMVVSEGTANSPVLLQFTDANLESRTLPDKVTVKITSDKAAHILNDAGEKNYKVAGNVLTLKLDKELVPSTSAPVTFTVEAEAPGYLATSQTFTLSSSDPAQFVMPLVNIKNPPKGVVAAQTTVSTSGGKITLSGGGTEVGNVAFKSGTQVMDASGNVINSANVSAEVVMFDAQEFQSLSAFPGGLMPENVLFNSGGSQDIRFVTAGFVAINMNAGGKEVKKFSKPIEVSMVVSPDIKDPQTGEPTREGSLIPTWSFETSTGKWKEEGVAVVSKNNKGELVAKFEASHLSYWNLDYYVPMSNSSLCPNNVTFKINSNVSSSFYGIYTTSSFYVARLFDQNNNFISEYSYFNIVNGSQITMGRAFGRLDGKMKLVVYQRNSPQEIIIGQATFDACTASVPLDITVSSPLNLVTINIDVTAVCKNKGLNLKPNVWYQLFNDEDWVYFNSVLQNGKASFQVKDGRNWGVTVFYDGKYYFGNAYFSRDGSKITGDGTGGVSTGDGLLSFNFGGNISGTASYNEATDTITYTAEYILSNCK